MQRLGMKRMLCSAGQKESQLLSIFLSVPFGIIFNASFYTFLFDFPIEFYLAVLRHGPSILKIRVARHLLHLACTDHKRDQIVEGGGIEALTALLLDGTAYGKAWAAMALSMLSRGADNGKVVRAFNGEVEALIALLREGSAAVKAQAAHDLMLAAFNVHNRVAVEALWRRCGGAVEAGAVEAGAVEAGAVEALSVLLRDGTAQGKAQAAMVLLVVTAGADEVADAGVIEALVAALREAEPEVSQYAFLGLFGKKPERCVATLEDAKTEAAFGLLLAVDNADNRVKIVQAGGVELLEAVERDGSPLGKTWAAAALQKLTKQTA